MKPYSEYSDLDLPWLTKIPCHWKICRAKNLFKPIDIRSITGKEDLLSVSEKSGVRLRKDTTVTMFKAESYVGYKLCWPGDLVINSLWAWMQGLGVSKYHGIVSSAYGVYRLNDNQLNNSKYLDYLLRSVSYLWELRVRSKGIWRSRYQLTDDSFFDMPILVPPPEEQTQIARYLDWKTAQINKFIYAKKRMIELLKEEIDLHLYGKNARKDPMRFLNWETSFPDHWKLRKAKRIFKEVSIKEKPEYELLAVTQDRGVIPKKLCGQNYVSPSGSLNALKVVNKNDFVISLRSFQGGIEYSRYIGIVSPAYNVIQLQDQFLCDEYITFYRYLFKTKPFISLLNTIISGVRDGKNINYSDFAEILLPIPDKKEIKSFAQLIKHFELYKENFDKTKYLLEEYKNCIVKEAVLGNIDVRDIMIPKVIENITKSGDYNNIEVMEESIDNEELAYADN